jgi:hypothetical protein
LSRVRAMSVDYARLADGFESVSSFLRGLFLE